MGIYQNIYDIIHTYIFGGVQMSSNMELVCILIATIGCVFLISIPFLLVWKLILTITR